MLDTDAQRLERINDLLVDARPDGRRASLRHVDLLVLRPSRDLGRIASEYEAELPPAFRFLTRGLGTREMRSNSMLSLIMFHPGYLRRLLDLGEADARARASELGALLNAAGRPALLAPDTFAAALPPDAAAVTARLDPETRGGVRV